MIRLFTFLSVLFAATATMLFPAVQTSTRQLTANALRAAEPATPRIAKLGESLDLSIVAPEQVGKGVPFMVQLQLPEGVGDHYRWSLSPESPTPPIELLSRDGKPMLWVQGIQVDTTVGAFAQIPKDGLDPVGQTSVVVRVGSGPEPGPGPTPPGPQSPLAKELQTAYNAETVANKSELFRQLAELYRQGAALANDPNVATYGQLFTVMSEAAKTLGVAGKLQGVQVAIQTHLKTQLPTQASTPLDRTKTATVFSGLVQAMEEVTK